MGGPLRKLVAIAGIPAYRRLAAAITGVYLLLFLVALQDISVGGRGVQVLTADWARMFERTGMISFEPIAQLTVPGLTVLIAPLNILIGLVLALLAGMNLTVTYLAVRQPAACRFNRSAGILASMPAMLAGSACCAPAVVLILGLQVSSLLITVFQVLIPLSLVLLVLALKVILDRTDTDRITATAAGVAEGAGRTHVRPSDLDAPSTPT
jgi:hypothetical protein